MDIGGAVTSLKDGSNVQRSGWVGENKYIFLKRNAAGIKHSHSIVIVKLNGTQEPWVCNQDDLLADDWQLLFEHEPLPGPS